MARKRAKGPIGFRLNFKGYEVLRAKDRNNREIRWHIVIAENKVGHSLRKFDVVHHTDTNKLNNNPRNLQILPNEKLHNLVHRMRNAFIESGNPFYRRCDCCGIYSDPVDMKPNNGSMRHSDCENKYHKEWRDNSSRYQQYKLSRKLLKKTIKLFSAKGKGAQANFGF